MIALGVDGIITNRPDVLESVIKAGRNDTLTR
jgi:glycerophosphoryl diester phosphodiesterase